jgi:hypothetical protein
MFKAGRQQGRSTAELAKALGICSTTLQRWADKAASSLRPSHDGGHELVRVEVAPPVTMSPSLTPTRPSVEPGSIRVWSPTGWQIEGLALEDAVELLRRLA